MPAWHAEASAASSLVMGSETFGRLGSRSDGKARRDGDGTGAIMRGARVADQRFHAIPGCGGRCQRIHTHN